MFNISNTWGLSAWAAIPICQKSRLGDVTLGCVTWLGLSTAAAVSLGTPINYALVSAALIGEECAIEEHHVAWNCSRSGWRAWRHWFLRLKRLFMQNSRSSECHLRIALCSAGLFVFEHSRINANQNTRAAKDALHMLVPPRLFCVSSIRVLLFMSCWRVTRASFTLYEFYRQHLQQCQVSASLFPWRR